MLASSLASHQPQCIGKVDSGIQLRHGQLPWPTSVLGLLLLGLLFYMSSIDYPFTLFVLLIPPTVLLLCPLSIFSSILARGREGDG